MCIGLCVEGYFIVLVCVLKSTSVCIGLCVEGYFSMYWFVC